MHTMHTIAGIAAVLGVLGVVEFLALGFAATQVSATSPARLQRKLASPVVRNSRLLVAVSAAVCIAGLVLLQG